MGEFKNSVLTTSDKNAVVESSKEKSIVEELCGKQVIDIKSGTWHVIARTIDGKVYCWGENRSGGLGNGREDSKMYKPVLNEYLKDKNIIDISCGHEYSLVLTIDGDVYAWGDNNQGQIGNGEDRNRVLIPHHVNGFNSKKVKAIACGYWHSIALTKTGDVFSWGNNYSGQLGIGIKVKNCKSPKQIEMNGIIVEKISCGLHHSLLLSRDGDIYVFGCNFKRQLGTDVENDEQFTPKKLELSNKFIDIASHYNYDISAALSQNGLYYIWGKWGRDKERKEIVIRKPEETHFKSFDDIYEHYFQINYKPIKERIILFDDTFIENGKYHKEFNELMKIGEGSYGEVFRVNKKSSQRWMDEMQVLGIGYFESYLSYKEQKFQRLFPEPFACGKLETNYIRQECLHYAMKKIRFTTDTESEFLKELETCIKIKQLYDERLVKYYEIWLEEDSIEEKLKSKSLVLYIQMELCDKTLKDIMKEMENDSNLKKDCLTPLGYYIASELFIRILEGVQYLHKREKPLIHRDLKPDNIMLKIESNKKSFVKVGDFGLAVIHEKVEQSMNETGKREFRSIEHTTDRGDIRYAAPEVLNGTKYNTKADIYSLGVIARELFNIDGDDLYSVPSVLVSKYQTISDLVTRMSDEKIDDRPDCGEMLEKQDSWTLNANEFDVQKSFENIAKLSRHKDSYILKLIGYVLKSNYDYKASSIYSLNKFSLLPHVV